MEQLDAVIDHRLAVRRGLPGEPNGPRSDVEDRSLTAVAEVLGMAKEVDDDHVLAAAADVAVLAGSADQHIVTGSADQPIIPTPSAQDVVAFSSADAVRRGGSADAVGAGGAVDLVQPAGDCRGSEQERDEQERDRDGVRDCGSGAWVKADQAQHDKEV